MLTVLNLIRNKSKNAILKDSDGDELNHRKIPEIEERIQDMVSIYLKSVTAFDN